MDYLGELESWNLDTEGSNRNNRVWPDDYEIIPNEYNMKQIVMKLNEVVEKQNEIIRDLTEG